MRRFGWMKAVEEVDEEGGECAWLRVTAVD